MANATLESPGPAISSNGAISNGDSSHLSLEAKIAWAKDVIAGRIVPSAMPLRADVVAHLKKEFGDRNPPPTPEAVRRISDETSLVEI